MGEWTDLLVAVVSLGTGTIFLLICDWGSVHQSLSIVVVSWISPELLLYVGHQMTQPQGRWLVLTPDLYRLRETGRVQTHG